MPFPNFDGKHAHDAFFTAKDFLAYRRREGRVPDLHVPEAVIFCYQSSLYQHVMARHEVERIDLFSGEFSLLTDVDGRVGVSARFGIGAPVVATILEEMIALGIRRFLSVGTAGTLSKQLRVGDLVVCDRAIRDEGVSHHYLPPGTYAHASPALTDRLEQALRSHGLAPVRGTSWTIDAPYRETVAEARHYQQEGVVTVEMEAAALFAVAAYHGVEMAAAFTVSDSLAELAWEPQFDAAPTQAGLVDLYRAALDALLA